MRRRVLCLVLAAGLVLAACAGCTGSGGARDPLGVAELRERFARSPEYPIPVEGWVAGEIGDRTEWSYGDQRLRYTIVGNEHVEAVALAARTPNLSEAEDAMQRAAAVLALLQPERSRERHLGDVTEAVERTRGDAAFTHN